jgi:capsular exopolysaccharide synthesis family protein
MSRIQNILDKAERDGATHRLRGMSDLTAAVLAPDASAAPVVPPASASDVARDPVAAPEAPPAHVVSGARLDPVLVAALAPDATAAEQYRSLRTRLAHANHGAPINVVLITSPGRGEGKSLTAANLGLTMAQDFQTRVCVVDAHLRHSRLHELFGLPEGPGLADVLSGRSGLAESLVTLENQHITLLPAGAAPMHPAELLGSVTMRRTIEALRAQFDRVIIDAPAAAPLADVGILTPLVDTVLLVVHAGTTSKPAIHEAVAAIGPSKLLGMVLNGVVAA